MQTYWAELEAHGMSPSAINVRMAALRKPATEAAANGLMAPELAGIAWYLLDGPYGPGQQLQRGPYLGPCCGDAHP